MEITSLKALTEFVEDAIKDAGVPLWYRGVNDSDHELLPYLYRHPQKKPVNEAIELEAAMLEMFKQRSIPYQLRNLSGDWDYLFLMQHYGVPTRLLDWTENPFIGLYFAIAHSKPEPNKDAVLWVLNPLKWNTKVLDRKNKKPAGEILSLGHVFLDAYKPGIDPELIRPEPVALYGIHNSSRIVSQKGVFTVFGKDNKPMEGVYTAGGFGENTLRKIIFPHANLADLSKSLLSIGLSESTLFPDLEGLAREIRRSKGFDELHV